MKKYWLILFVIAQIITLTGQIPELNIWNNIRNSSYTQEDEIHIRCETFEMPFIATELYYMLNDEWIRTDMENLGGLSVEGVIDGSHQEDMICRFRTYGDSLVGMMPAYVPNDVFPPDINHLSKIAADPEADTLTGGPEQLDLLGTYFGFSDSRFYLAMQNNGTGFPTDEGGWFPAEYYVYLAGLVNPENALIDSSGYGIVYTEVPLFFQPGLYRFSGVEMSLDNLQQIAEIETAVVDSFLFLAFDKDDLLNDEFFGEWPSISRSLGLEFITARFSISFQDSLELDYGLMDFSVPSLQVIDQYIIEPFVNEIPVISNITAEVLASTTNLQVTYEDENNNFPLIAHVSTDTDEVFELYPTSLDFSQPVVFEAELPITDWNSLNIYFSDNGFDFVEEMIYNTSAENDLPNAISSLQNYPNPFNPSTTIFFSLNAEITEDIELMIYNIRGQKVKDLTNLLSHQSTNHYSVTWNGTDENEQPVQSGIYLCKLNCGNKSLNRKLILLK